MRLRVGFLMFKITFLSFIPALSTGQVLLTDTLNKPKFGRAALELGLAEITPYVLDRYVRHAKVYYISFKTLSNNINPSSWAFDNDPLGTNQFGHPYHGSLFFNAYRANGYSFWQAAPAALVGSYIWETAAENQPPATNDFINTGFGGIVLGEMTYRLFNKIVNNRTRGVKRQVSEVFGLIVNPMNGLTRIMNGKWGKVAPNSPERDSSVINAEFDLGIRKINGGKQRADFGWFGHMKLLYGTPYEDFKTPFSNIAINTEFGKDDSTKVNIISVYGSLTGWRIRSSEDFRHSVVLSANYDYINNQSFFYSAQSVKFNLFSELKLRKICKVNTNFGTGLVLLGAVPDGYMYYGRNYDYGMGIGVNAGGSIVFANKFYYTLNYRGGWLKTVNGNKSYYFLHTLSSEVRYRFAERFSACAEGGYFTLHGHYTRFANVNRDYPYLRISARYDISIQ